MKKGFALAEVLITLVIIGVVAALTIPIIVGEYNKQVLYTQFMEARSLLNKALQMSTAKYGFVRDWAKNDDTDILNGITPCRQVTEYLSVAKTCKYGDSSCLLDSAGYKTIDGQTNSSWNNVNLVASQYSYILKNGMAFMIFKVYNAGIYTCRAYIDVNGKKGPNRMGRDFFEFDVNPDNNTFEPFGSRNGFFRGKLVNISASKCLNEVYGRYCGAYLLQKGKMDY